MKKFFKYNFLLCLFLFCAFRSRKTEEEWQEVKVKAAASELIAINSRLLKNQCYSFHINYTSYSEHTSTEPHDFQSGSVMRDGFFLRSKVAGALTIQNKKWRIVADSAKHFVKIGNAQEGKDPVFNLSDYIKIMSTCKAIKRREVNGIVAYRVEMKATMGIVAQEIYLGQDFLVKSIIYYVKEHQIRKGETTATELLHPKLEITISDFKKLDKVNKTIFSTVDILVQNKNDIILKGKYRSFKFFDGRINK